MRTRLLAADADRARIVARDGAGVKRHEGKTAVDLKLAVLAISNCWYRTGKPENAMRRLFVMQKGVISATISLLQYLCYNTFTIGELATRSVVCMAQLPNVAMIDVCVDWPLTGRQTAAESPVIDHFASLWISLLTASDQSAPA